MKPVAECVWMDRAIELARLSEGFTRPNPPVGAVVVKRGRVIGEGRHRRAGLPHAEVEALASCTCDPAGATLYVTLEPCSTHGRTPPCTDLIIRSKLARVVVGCADPNPRHAKQGFDLLRGAGIEAACWCECADAADPRAARAAACRELIAPFVKHVRTGLPFVTLKLAMTLDGRIADRRGRSQWITGPEARAEVQRLRRTADAVLVGAGTVAADNPSLLCRLPEAGPLMRVVVDASGRSPARAKIFTDESAARTIVATTAATAAVRGDAWSRHGAQVWTYAPDRAGRIPLGKLLADLGSIGLCHVLCEGGGVLAGSLIDGGWVDGCAFFYAPALMGDSRACSGVAGRGFTMADLPRLKLREVRRIGDDVLIRAMV